MSQATAHGLGNHKEGWVRHYNGWLWGKLKAEFGEAVESNYSPLITVNTPRKTYKIWSPPPQDYRVSRDCVREVSEIGGNLISYASLWGEPTMESASSAEQYGVEISSHGETFNTIRRSLR